jgi:hypothetical protein
MKLIQGDVDLSNQKLYELPLLNDVIVNGNFWASGNELTNLKGCPMEVTRYCDCSFNKLTSLKGSPQKVGGDFNIRRNSLTSLEGAPEQVGANFHCDHNEAKFTEEQVRAVCKVKGRVYC